MLALVEGASEILAGFVDEFIGNCRTQLLNDVPGFAFGRNLGHLNNLLCLGMSLLDNALFEGFSLLFAFGKDCFPLGIEVGNMRLNFSQACLGFFTLCRQVINAVLDFLFASPEEIDAQFAQEVPQNGCKDNKVDTTPCQVSPA